MRLHPFLWLSLLSICGCSDLPKRTAAIQNPSQFTRPLATTAQKIDLKGIKGRLSARKREQLLHAFAAQNKKDLVAHHLAIMTAEQEIEIYKDNKVQLLVDGPATFKAMFKAIETAQKSIYLESYIIEDRNIAQQMANLLIHKTSQGVQVFIVYDAVGSLTTSEEFFKNLKLNQVGVCQYNPVNPLRRIGYWDINNRDHRKVLVVDNKIAMTGGINISEVYSSGSISIKKNRGVAAAEKGWRDTQVLIEGPAASEFSELFRETWVGQGCTPTFHLVSKPNFEQAAGNKLVRVIPSNPDTESSQIYATLLSAIDGAIKSIHITMAYFAPGDEMIDALCDAAKRGVEVSLILPSKSDFNPVLNAGRYHYQRLLDSDVKIYELQDAVLHAKTAIIDGVFSTIGSSNMDWRSFTQNSEINTVILGEDFSQEMENLFQKDLHDSQRIDMAQWKNRPYLDRLKQWSAHIFEKLF